MHRRVISFHHALRGIWTALKDQPNLKFHFLVAYLVILGGIFFDITQTQWLIIVFMIGLVISLELTNSAIEEVVDFFTQNLHPGAKRAKDIAAGSVLIASITAAIVGLVIFIPYILESCIDLF